MRSYDAPPGFEFNPKGTVKQYQKRINKLENDNAALRNKLAKSCSEDQRYAFGGCPIANGLTASLAVSIARVTELEADLQNYGWHAVTCASAWPARACDCGFKDAIDKIGGGK